MNRKEELAAILQQLETIPPETEGAVQRAKARYRRRTIWKPLVSLAAVFCLFVGMVNLSPTVAAACREIPLLQQLVDALTFAPSLQKAVENDYIQTMGLEETSNGITVRVEHVIVDQKQVNIFYTVTPEQEAYYAAWADVLTADGQQPNVSGSFGTDRVTAGEMRQITLDYMDEQVPDQLRLTVDVMHVGTEEPTVAQWDAAMDAAPMASFDFLLTFDPAFTAQGRVMTVNQTMELDGNRLTVQNVEVYPTHIRIQLEEDADNPDWLSTLRFHLELEDGTIIEAIRNGTSAYGNSETPSMLIYAAESTFFYQAKQIRLVITGADFLAKDFETVYVNFETGETGALPENVDFLEANRSGTGWAVTFAAEKMPRRAQTFVDFFDAAGSEIESNRFSCTTHLEDESREEETYHLEHFTGTEAWFEPNYTHAWRPETPVTINVEVK